jgi:ABC-type lipoprotein release transport system permease subunit
MSKLLFTSFHARVTDPVMLLAVSGVLFSITAIACLYPAWRAASINPLQAIRTE